MKLLTIATVSRERRKSDIVAGPVTPSSDTCMLSLPTGELNASICSYNPTGEGNPGIDGAALPLKGRRPEEAVSGRPARLLPNRLTRELGVMDAAAFSLCKDNDLPIVVLNIQKHGALLAALRGESVGTLVS